MQDPNILNAMRLLHGTDNSTQDAIDKKADAKVHQMSELAKRIQVTSNGFDTKQAKTIRIYIDGVFDLPHSGHYNAIRQARAMGDHLVLGVCSDSDVLKFKGPTIFNTTERAEIMRHCKFIDEVVEDVEYATTLN